MKSGAEIAAAIKTPKDPMPKLYPGVLKDVDVDGLVQFIKTLR